MKQIEFNDLHTNILFDIQFFRDLQDHTKRMVLEKLEMRVFEVEKNEIVITQGTPCKRLYVLLKGRLQTDIIDANGDNVLIEHIVAPRAFATPHLFKEDNRFPATFTAVEESVLLTASKESTFRLISECPEVLRSFFCIAGRCNVCTTARLDILSRKTVRERLTVYLFNHKETGGNRVKMIHTQTQLAEYLNVSRPALSTEINKMEREGLIKKEEKNVIQLNLLKLKELL